MTKLSRVLALAFVLSLAATGAAQAATPPGDAVGQGTQFWAYPPANDSGTGPLIVAVDTRASDGVAPGTARITYSFSSGSQTFFWNSGSVTATGSWDTGWSFSSPIEGTNLTVGPFGDGTSIPFHLLGNAQVDVGGAGFGEGPWTVDGSFSVTAGQ